MTFFLNKNRTLTVIGLLFLIGLASNLSNNSTLKPTPVEPDHQALDEVSEIFGSSQVAGVYDSRFLNPLAFSLPDYWKELPIKLGQKIRGEFTSILLRPDKAQTRLASGDGWVELTLRDSLYTPAEIINNKAYYRDVYNGVNVDIRPYDGLMRQLVTISDPAADTEYELKLIADSSLKIAPMAGGYVPIVDKSTQVEAFILKVPQGIGINGARVDYKYEIGETTQKGNQFETIIKLIPARFEQFDLVEYPVKIDTSIQVVAWDEALVKVGENGSAAGNAKDGDIVTIKPAGWNWGIEERKRFVIVRIPKNPDRLFGNDGRGYGIDYTKLVIPENLALIRNPNIASPVLDATKNLEVIQQKPYILGSVIPAESRLVYQPSKDINWLMKTTHQISKPAFAVTTVVSSIGTAARDYSTMQAWEDAVDGNLITRSIIQKGELYADSDFTGTIKIDGSITDDSNYMHLGVAIGERHNGTVAGGGVVVDRGGSLGAVVDIRDPHTRIDWLRITNIDGGNFYGAIESNDGGTTCVIANLIIHDLFDDQVDGIQLGTDGCTVYNTLVYNTARLGITTANGADNTFIYNSTVFNNKVAGIDNNAGLMTVTNVISMGNGGSDFDGAITQAYNISSDNTALGIGSKTTEQDTDIFISLNQAEQNFHLKYGSVAVDAGTALSGGFTTDIDGTTRSGSWDIGADEAEYSIPTINSVKVSPDPACSGCLVTFKFDWHDADDGELIKAKLCKTNSLTNQNCDGGFWASSSAFTIDNTEALTYLTKATDGEVIDWYGFVCDYGGACSTATNSSTTISTLGTKNNDQKSR